MNVVGQNDYNNKYEIKEYRVQAFISDCDKNKQENSWNKETRKPKRGRTGGGEAGEGSRCGRRTDE